MIVVRECLLIVFQCGKRLRVGFLLHDTAGCCSFIFVGRFSLAGGGFGNFMLLQW